MVTCQSDQTNAMQAAAAANFPISPRSTPVMAEEPASKPFHVIPTQRTKLVQASAVPLQWVISLWRLRVHEVTVSGRQQLSYLGHAFAPLSQALDGRTDTQRVQGYRYPKGTGLSMPMAWSWRISTPDGAIAVSDTRLTNDKARRISKLIGRLP
jgi:hypothetical protein